MNNNQQTEKRIVSKRDFLLYAGTSAGLSTLGRIFTFSGTLLLYTAALALICFVMLCLMEKPSGIPWLFLAVCIGPFGYVCDKVGAAIMTKANQMDIGMADLILLDSEAALQFRAEDSLVRASQEPEQQTVLLRPAVYGTEEHAEQLLRPVDLAQGIDPWNEFLGCGGKVRLRGLHRI